MRIHEVELTNVRHLKHVRLDLSAPVTVIHGRNGAAKTTVQQAILTAMFRQRSKEFRDSLVSRFDPDVPPQATLKLSRGESQPTITLRRTLTDDQGTWTEAGKTIRAKGQALEKIQESFPISSAAAALLLWGLQEEMSKVLSEFPQDGHALLTAATVRGGGPDPAAVVKDLRKQIGEANKGARGDAKNPGALTLAARVVESLERELAEAELKQQRLRELEEQAGRARNACERLARQRAQLDDRIAEGERLLELLESAQREEARLEQLRARSAEIQTLSEEILAAERQRDVLAEDLRTLESQWRSVREVELATSREAIVRQIASAEEAHGRVAELSQRIAAARRPGRDDMKKLAELQKQIDTANDRVEASGFHYQVAVTRGEQRIEVVEDQQQPLEVSLRPDSPLQGIAGSVLFRAGDLEISASGKEDVASHKRRIERAQVDLQTLLSQFQVPDNAALAALANEQERLQSDLADARAELERRLAGRRMDELRERREALTDERRRNGATEADHAACAGRHLPASSELEKRVVAKDAELTAARKQLEQFRARQLDGERRAQLRADLDATEKAAVMKQDAFQHADSRGRRPSQSVRDEIRDRLRIDRDEQRNIAAKLAAVDKESIQLTERLRHERPARRIATIEAELDEARLNLMREMTLQEARELLAERIEARSTALAAAVPEELARRVSAHLAEISGGVYRRIMLNPQLQVIGVEQTSEHAEAWRPDQLSTGERTLAALTMKIAVARSLAEMRHPVFVMLDDSFVNLDPRHREATERLFGELTADGHLQVVLLTCHSDWAEAWQSQSPEGVRVIDLEQTAEYHRVPATAGVE